MDPDTEIVLELPVIRLYKSGHVKRLMGDDVVPAGTDEETGVTCKDVIIDSESNVKARIFLPKIQDEKQHKLPIVVYYHGGGFCSFSPFSFAFTRYLNSIVAKANVVAVSVGYRLVPEHPLPIAYEDSFAAIKRIMSREVDDEWLNKYGDFNRVFLAGDSAGGNIVHHMASRASGMGIKGVAMIHPWFWSSQSSMELAKKDKQGSAMMETFLKLAYPKGYDDPLVNPMAVGSPSLESLACEMLLVIVAESDQLRNIGREYFEAVKNSGWSGKLEFFETEGEGHAFHLFNPSGQKAMDLVQRLAIFFNEH